MLSIEDRLRKREFWAFVALDSMDALIERVRPLFETGRRMTKVSGYHSSGMPRVKTGLVLYHEGFRPALLVEERTDPGGNPRLTGKFFSANLTPSIEGFHFGASASDGTEAEVAARFHSAKPTDAVLITVHGFGEGQEDRIEMTRYNEFGVGEDIVIAFDLLPMRDRVEQDVRVIEALSQQQPTWTAEDLTGLAETMRYYERTVEQQFDPTKRRPYDRD